MVNIKEIERNRQEKTLLYITHPGENNLSFVLPQILAEKGLSVSISKCETDLHFVEVYASPFGSRVLEKLEETPEFDAICSALSGTVVSEIEVEDCNWDESTKRRVQALFWQSRADFFEKMASHIKRPLSFYGRVTEQRDEDEVQKSRILTRELLGDLPQLSPEDIRSLLTEVVDRVLSQPQQPS